MFKRFVNISPIIYFLLLSALSWILPIPAFVKALLAFPGFILLPWGMGKTILFFLEKLWKRKWEFQALTQTILAWFTGFLFLSLLGNLLGVLHIFSMPRLLALSLICAVFGFTKIPPLSWEIKKTDLWPPLISGMLMAFMMSLFNPYPYSLDTDQFQHNALIFSFLENHYNFYTARFYSLSFHTLFGLLSMVFNFSENAFPLFWTIRFLTFPLSALGIFLFLRTLSKSKWVAWFGAFVAPWFMIKHLSLAEFAPKVLSYLILPFLLFALFHISKNIPQKKKVFFPILGLLLYIGIVAFLLYRFDTSPPGAEIVLGISVFLAILCLSLLKTYRSWLFPLFLLFLVPLLIHFPMGTLTLLVLTIFLLGSHAYTLWPKATTWIQACIIIFLLGYLGLQYFEYIDLSRYRIDWYEKLGEPYNFFNRLDQPKNAVSPFIAALASFGFFLFQKKRLHVNLSAILIASIYFSPTPTPERIFPTLFPFIAYFSGSLLERIYFLLKGSVMKPLVLNTILLVVLTSLFYPLEKITKSWLVSEATEGKLSIMTPTEYQAAQWIEKKKDEKKIIISDPVLSRILSGYANQINPWATVADLSLKNILLNQDPATTYAEIVSLGSSLGTKPIIVIDGRTSHWIASGDFERGVVPNHPEAFITYPGFENFLNTDYYKQIYRYKDLFIFEPITLP